MVTEVSPHQPPSNTERRARHRPNSAARRRDKPPRIDLVVAQVPWALELLEGRGLRVGLGHDAPTSLSRAICSNAGLLITAPKVGDDEALSILTQQSVASQDIDVAVVIPPEFECFTLDYISYGARDVVSLGDAEHLLELVARSTAIRMDHGARLRRPLAIRAETAGWRLMLEARDIRASGVAVRSLPPMPVGAIARVSFEIADRTFSFTSKLARRWNDRRGSGGAFKFIGLSPAQKWEIERCLEGTEGASARPRRGWRSQLRNALLAAGSPPPHLHAHPMSGHA